MPNYCNYNMKVIGKKENVEELLKILNFEYYVSVPDKENPRISNGYYIGPHMYRVFEADSSIEEQENGFIKVNIDGYCAWSVSSCMTDDIFSYFDQNKFSNSRAFNYKYNLSSYDRNDLDVFGTCLKHESKKLGLDIELWSDENEGMFFQEHYRYIFGDEIINESSEYHFSYEEEDPNDKDYKWDENYEGYVCIKDRVEEVYNQPSLQQFEKDYKQTYGNNHPLVTHYKDLYGTTPLISIPLIIKL